MAHKRKLIEVALPLEVINRESAREKSIRHGHPSTLHLWWARRPLAAARAVLFAQLVDDPSSHPDRFPTEEAQKAERERLHKIIEDLVVWENIRDERLLERARAEILASTDGNPPPILDPFAGGGTIPLEAQRLGLEAHASDLNPVAVLINKALIEFPPKFRDRPPVFPGLAASETTPWTGARGLAADVRAYGQWMRDEAEKRIGHLYPKADGKTVIAWIWARTVTCPNPACGIEMPLVRSWWLGKKKGKEAYVVPSVVADPSHPSGKRVAFEIGHDPKSAPTASNDATMSGRSGAVCIACKTAVSVQYVRDEHMAGRGGQALTAIVVEGNRRRDYVPPTHSQIEAARVERPADSVDGDIATNPRWFSPPAYGLTKFADLFTNRQLVSLTAFSDLITEARNRVVSDAQSSGMQEGESLEPGGIDANSYADAIAVYLALWIGRILNRSTSLSIWNTVGEKVEQLFARNAIPMMWDFPEANLFSDSSGNALGQLDYLVRSLAELPARGSAIVQQAPAATTAFNGTVLATDPPYYDNIGYSDLSDFFYVWLRRSLQPVLPESFGTLLVPKSEELVANPYRHGGTSGAKAFFEHGFRSVFARACKDTRPDIPATLWYAFKQSDTNSSGTASTGWETLLEGMVNGGWSITSTWPMRSERTGRMGANGTNSLASAIVLSIRPRPEAAPTTDRPGFIAALKSELGEALEKLQAGGIAPVDLPQAAIGPGMAVFSRYSAVREFDGTRMSVRSALSRINEVLDEVLSEQEGDFDPTTRFCLAWYRQYGYGEGQFGDADNLARARNTAVAALHRDEVLHSAAGKVRLFRPTDLSDDYDVLADDHTSAWEALHHLIRILEAEGVTAAGTFLTRATGRSDGAVDPELVTELAHLLFRISEDNKWAKEAISFNSLVTAWTDIQDAARTSADAGPGTVQGALDFGE